MMEKTQIVMELIQTLMESPHSTIEKNRITFGSIDNFRAASIQFVLFLAGVIRNFNFLKGKVIGLYQLHLPF
ncbi:hypothetical protein D9X91_13895 [Falsibacillus albus]|uniref:Uncharacterized protein n=1 Tax=Falsibacillus albus TaxID=2478915 RepID=A0A3L7K1S1_9BACI|nr:hypothetical protein D9X91_13895 [Falsibacillus albus]